MAQASAEESILQMTTRPALNTLKGFIANPTTRHASLLIDIPTLYDLIRYEHGLHKEYPDALISMCKWIYERGISVLGQLLVHSSPLVRLGKQSEGEWSKVTYSTSEAQCAILTHCIRPDVAMANPKFVVDRNTHA